MNILFRDGLEPRTSNVVNNDSQSGSLSSVCGQKTILIEQPELSRENPDHEALGYDDHLILKCRTSMFAGHFHNPSTSYLVRQGFANVLFLGILDITFKYLLEIISPPTPVRPLIG